MKMTLLSMTQSILSAMNGEPVSSIGDTIESQQVAQEIETTYYEISESLTVPTYQGLIQLNGLGDTAHPNYLSIPTNVKDINWIRYNTNTLADPEYLKIPYIGKKAFLDQVLQFDATQSYIQVITDIQSGMKFMCRNNNPPTMWTSFDNLNLIFDSFNNTVDTTLAGSKAMAWGEYLQAFTMADTFIPNLDDTHFPLFLAEATAACFINIKQVSNAKAEQRARRQRTRLQNDRYRANQRNYLSQPNFGRVKGGALNTITEVMDEENERI